jgi:hypothetical protein
MPLSKQDKEKLKKLHNSNKMLYYTKTVSGVKIAIADDGNGNIFQVGENGVTNWLGSVPADYTSTDLPTFQGIRDTGETTAGLGFIGHQPIHH